MLLYGLLYGKNKGSLHEMLHCWACTVCYKKMAVRSVLLQKYFGRLKGQIWRWSPALGIFSEDLDFLSDSGCGILAEARVVKLFPFI